MEIAFKIKELMKRDGIDGKQLSKRIGISAGNLSQILNKDYRKLKVGTLENIANEFKVPVSYLVYDGEDDSQLSKYYFLEDMDKDDLENIKFIHSLKSETRARIWIILKEIWSLTRQQPANR